MILTSEDASRRTELSVDSAFAAGSAWYVASILPGQDARAHENLQRQGLTVFWPRQKRAIRHARRMTNRIAPYFPGYMFLNLDLKRDRWRSVNGTWGVRSLIMQSERPLPCPAGLIDELRGLTDEHGIVNLGAGLQAGQTVKIQAGPFAAMVGRLERLDGSDRGRVLLSIMNADIPVDILLKDLAAA